MTYMVISGLCAFDKRGKEVYFAQDPTEYEFRAALAMKKINPQYSIKTDDWGYFQRAFQRVQDTNDSYWSNYDAFLAILVTAGVVGIYWIVTCIVYIVKLVNHSTTIGKKVLQIHLLYRLLCLALLVCFFTLEETHISS